MQAVADEAGPRRKLAVWVPLSSLPRGAPGGLYVTCARRSRKSPNPFRQNHQKVEDAVSGIGRSCSRYGGYLFGVEMHLLRRNCTRTGLSIMREMRATVLCKMRPAANANRVRGHSASSK
jgi:hypothetical protein